MYKIIVNKENNFLYPISLFSAAFMILLFSSFSTTSLSLETTDTFGDAEFKLSLDNSLVSFTGRYLGDKDVNIINWITASDENTDYFTLERSIDNGPFEEIGKVDAKSTGSAEALYSFDDTEILIGGIYNYRLQQVSRNDSSVWSDLVSINVRRLVESETSVKVFPDTASELVNVDIVKGESDVVSVNLFDLRGKSVTINNVNVFAGGSFASVQIPVTKLPKATYILRIDVGNQVFIKKVTLVE